MLIRYKNNFEKIVMGLLSFNSRKKDGKNMQQTIKHYELEDDWNLYLWREEDSFLGAIGIRIIDGMSVIIQHVTVDPSHRNQGIGRKMVKSIRDKYGQKYEIVADEQVKDFYQKCLEKNDL